MNRIAFLTALALILAPATTDASGHGSGRARAVLSRLRLASLANRAGLGCAARAARGCSNAAYGCSGAAQSQPSGVQAVPLPTRPGVIPVLPNSTIEAAWRQARTMPVDFVVINVGYTEQVSGDWVSVRVDALPWHPKLCVVACRASLGRTGPVLIPLQVFDYQPSAPALRKVFGQLRPFE